MDSLLDALTNVVGILVIVLVAVQISSQEAASRIVEEFKKQLDPTQLAAERQHAEQVKERLERLERDLRREMEISDADPAIELKRLQDELKRIEALAEKTTAEAKSKTAKITKQRSEVEKQLAELNAMLAKLEEQTEAAEKQKLALTAELNRTRKPLAPPAAEVRLTAPQAPVLPAQRDDGSYYAHYLIPVNVLCRGEEIIPFWTPEKHPQFQRWRNQLLVKLGIATDKDGWVQQWDSSRYPTPEKMREELVLACNKTMPRLPEFREYEFSFFVAGRHLCVREAPKEEAGETIKEVATNRSKFNTLLNLLALKAREEKRISYYLKYAVEPDAFETYLDVRNFTDSWRLPGDPTPYWAAAGWEPRKPGPYTATFHAGIQPAERPAPPEKPTARRVSNALD
jgi:actin-related protein